MRHDPQQRPLPLVAAPQPTEVINRRWYDAPLIQLIRAEMQRFTGRQYQIAFDQFDVKSLQELLRFLLDAEYEHPRS
jgi:hypothetical protein